MTTRPFEETFHPYSVTHCLHCGDPIAQPRHGGRPRRYCDKPACRKAGSRLAQKLAEEREDQVQRDSLRLLWQRLSDPTTIVILEEILATYGTNAATLTTEALKREREALKKLAEAQVLAGTTALENQVRDLQQRLAAVQEVEIRFRLDTQARHCKAWLRKQGTYPPDSFPRRFLEDERFPLYASRSMYEAKLRAYHYAEEDIAQFQELWKALLIAQV